METSRKDGKTLANDSKKRFLRLFFCQQTTATASLQVRAFFVRFWLEFRNSLAQVWQAATMTIAVLMLLILWSTCALPADAAAPCARHEFAQPMAGVVGGANASASVRCRRCPPHAVCDGTRLAARADFFALPHGALLACEEDDVCLFKCVLLTLSACCVVLLTACVCLVFFLLRCVRNFFVIQFDRIVSLSFFFCCCLSTSSLIELLLSATLVLMGEKALLVCNVPTILFGQFLLRYCVCTTFHFFFFLACCCAFSILLFFSLLL